jgi:hypothetical protein
VTENEFWVFLESSQARGRVSQVSGCVDSGNKFIQNEGKYFAGHSILFEGYNRLARSIIAEMAGLIFTPGVTVQSKEAILMILAHHPSKEALQALTRYDRNPDKGLECYARLALEECECWNE